MRRLIIFVFSIVLLVPLLSSVAYAHPGKTDGNGGHYDRDSDEYHYHHGYPAHSHTSGECPYNFDDKTGHNSNSSNTNDSNNNKTIKNTKDKSSSVSLLKIITTLLESVVIFFMIGFLIVLICEVFSLKILDKAPLLIVILIGIFAIVLSLTTDFIF